MVDLTPDFAMQLPPVHSISATEYFVSGNVIIHETAAIAPGAILEADPGCQIMIGAGVCIGLGTVIIAYGGNVQIEDGVVLAPGSLVIGPVTIGHSACVGSRSTIFQQDVAAQASIAAGDLLMVAPSPPLNSQNFQAVPPTATNEAICPIPSPWDSTDPAVPTSSANSVNPENPEQSPDNPVEKQVEKAVKQESEVVPPPKPESVPEIIPTKPEIAETSENSSPKAPVVGQVYISQLLLTLFPDRKYFQS